MPRIAFLTAGGIAPCLSASIGALIARYKEICPEAEFIGYRNGYQGLLKGNYISFPQSAIDNHELFYKYGGSPIGNSRVKLTNFEDCVKRGLVEEGQNPLEVAAEQLRTDTVDILHTIGGDDTNTTAADLAAYLQDHDYPFTVVGLPKTVDNDLPVTDNCPGFGSVAKYVAVSTQEAALDVASMAETSTKVFILEVMGRHAGWIAAAGGLAGKNPEDAPHIILFPEIPFKKREFLKKVRQCVNDYGYCVIVVSEGAQFANGKFLADQGTRDAFGHAQLGGVAPVVATMVRDNLGFKYHYAIADYLQRSARHIASDTDVKQAYAVGKKAVEFALQGKTAVMPVIKRVSDKPYRWKIESAPLGRIANKEKMLPRRYITKDGFGITEACRCYLQPLIKGENYPPYINGLPKTVKLKNKPVKAKTGTKFVV